MIKGNKWYTEKGMKRQLALVAVGSLIMVSPFIEYLFGRNVYSSFKTAVDTNHNRKFEKNELDSVYYFFGKKGNNLEKDFTDEEMIKYINYIQVPRELQSPK
jgi:hypothetical protein